MTLHLALLLLLATGGLTADGTRLLLDGEPVALRGLVYPLDARRDGLPLDVEGFVRTAQGSGVNLLVLPLGDGPALADGRAMIAAASRTGLWVVIQPMPSDDAALAARLVREFGAARSVIGWTTGDSPPAALRDRPLLRVAPGRAPATAGATAVWSTLPALYQTAQGFGRWSAALAAQREESGLPLLVNLAAAPPPDLFADLRTAAPQTDLYRDAHYRPATAASFGGEALLLPEPAQLRLQAWAAVGAGARGVIFDHAGHLAHGPDPFNGADRAAEISSLNEQMRWFAPFLAAADPLPPPPTPPGVAAALLELGAERLLLLWRDRPLDTRSVGGQQMDPFWLDVPVGDGPLMVHELAPDGMVSTPADRRERGVRIRVEAFDLTAAWLLTATDPAALRERIAAGLPDAARRSIFIASRRLEKVAYTVRRLERQGASAGSGRLLATAREQLYEAAQAESYGYHRTAWALAQAAERGTRAAQELELSPVLAARAVVGDPTYPRTFATIAALADPPTRAPDGPFPLAPGSDLRVTFGNLAPGSIPPRWTALRGFDQTVATLRVAGETDRRHLRWQPVGADAGALYLPFTPQPALTLTVQLRVTEPLAGRRMILLAAGAGQTPCAGLVLRPDGGIEAYRGEVTGWRWRVGEPLMVRFRVADGTVVAALGEAGEVSLGACAEPVGALVLAKPEGPDSTALEIESIIGSILAR